MHIPTNGTCQSIKLNYKVSNSQIFPSSGSNINVKTHWRGFSISNSKVFFRSKATGTTACFTMKMSKSHHNYFSQSELPFSIFLAKNSSVVLLQLSSKIRLPVGDMQISNLFTHLGRFESANQRSLPIPVRNVFSISANHFLYCSFACFGKFPIKRRVLLCSPCLLLFAQLASATFFPLGRTIIFLLTILFYT